MSEPDGRFTITLRDVYEAQQAENGQLAAIGTQLATLTARVDERLGSGQRKMEDHEKRIRAIERFRFTLVGAAMATSAVSSTIGALVVWALSHH
jgi:hypothetical protein